jgi:hypothetical protein
MCVLKGRVINHAFLSLLDNNVLRRDKEVWDESPQPTQEGNDAFVPVFLMHGLLDLWYIFLDRGIVPLLSVLHSIIVADVCVDRCRTSTCHEAPVLLHQEWGYFVGQQGVFHSLHVSVHR